MDVLTGVGTVLAASGRLPGAIVDLETMIETTTGWPGLLLVFVYSFLVAFVLPGPSEVVLAAPIDLGLSRWGTLACIILVSAVGKALGSAFAFHVGQGVKQSGPLTRWLRRSRFDVLEWTETRTVALTQRYGYLGLILVLSVPLFPDTLPIYAFAVLSDDYLKFALATFVGSVFRLLVTLGIVGGLLAVV